MLALCDVLIGRRSHCLWFLSLTRTDVRPIQRQYNDWHCVPVTRLLLDAVCWPAHHRRTLSHIFIQNDFSRPDLARFLLPQTALDDRSAIVKQAGHLLATTPTFAGLVPPNHTLKVPRRITLTPTLPSSLLHRINIIRNALL